MTLLIIIPTFQRPRLLKSCLDSVCSQSTLNVNVLVVDQSFDDASSLLCKQYSQVRYIHANYQNKSRAINESIAKSDEDLISIIDDDTILDKNWATAVFHAFSDSTTDIIQGSIQISDDSLNDSVENNQDIITKRQVVGRVCFPPLFKIGCNFAFRRHVFETAGNFNESLGPGTKNKAGEDLEWGYRVFKHGFKLLLNPEMCISHTSWRGKEELQKQTEEYGHAFGKVLRIVRKDYYVDFLIYFIHYLVIGYVVSVIKGDRKEWFKAAWKGYFES